MLKQIHALFKLMATFTAIFSVCLFLWFLVGLFISFGYHAGKALAGIIV